MAYSDPLAGNGGQPAQISDKTMQIALHFQSKKDYLHMEASREISRELRVLLRETGMLEFCLSQLDDVHEQVLRRHYFAKRPWRELQEEFSLSQRALIKRRDEAVDALIEMVRMCPPLPEAAHLPADGQYLPGALRRCGQQARLQHPRCGVR